MEAIDLTRVPSPSLSTNDEGDERILVTLSVPKKYADRVVQAASDAAQEPIESLILCEPPPPPPPAPRPPVVAMNGAIPVAMMMMVLGFCDSMAVGRMFTVSRHFRVMCIARLKKAPTPRAPLVASWATHRRLDASIPDMTLACIRAMWIRGFRPLTFIPEHFERVMQAYSERLYQRNIKYTQTSAMKKLDITVHFPARDGRWHTIKADFDSILGGVRFSLNTQRDDYPYERVTDSFIRWLVGEQWDRYVSGVQEYTEYKAPRFPL
jgi:hypothetical protein